MSSYQAFLEGGDFPTPIGKIVCLARNYVEHAAELGNEVPEEPVLFIKPASSLVYPGGQVEIPAYSNNCHHEVELAVLIFQRCKNVSVETAMDYVHGYGVAIDMTLRDTQAKLKEKGYPWEIAKGFDTSCPLSIFKNKYEAGDPHNLGIQLRVNGELRQDSTTACMVRKVPEIIAYVSSIFTLDAGDVILTGTPAGVGPVHSGDVMEAWIEDVGSLKVSVK